MKYIIELPEGEIVVKKLAENPCNPLEFIFELDCALPVKIEKRLQQTLKKSKIDRYKKIVGKFPNRYEELGYECVEDIPEYIVFTSLDLTFSEEGNGLEKAEIRRMISDRSETLENNFECDTAINVELADQIEDIKWLIHHYLDKLIFQKRILKNYVM